MHALSPCEDLEAVLQELSRLGAEMERMPSDSEPDTDSETGTCPDSGAAATGRDFRIFSHAPSWQASGDSAVERYRPIGKV